jgi:hypothetical protein
MKIPVKTGGSVTPEGDHPAICISVIDLGLQRTAKFGNKPQVLLTFELPGCMVTFKNDETGKDETRPRVVSKTFNKSMNVKSTLRKCIERIRGAKFTDEQAADFDLATLLGKPCVLEIVHAVKGDKTYANVESYSRYKGEALKQTHASWVYDLAQPNDQLYQQFPAWLQKRISERVQTAQRPGTPVASAEDQDFNDDIPF